MTPSELRTLLAGTIPAGIPVLVSGKPGIGKSDILAAAAVDAGADMILSHPAVADPTDAKGLPWFDATSGRASFHPFGALYRAMHAEKLTVWFWDDLGQASPAVQASHMQLLQARRVDDHILPDCVTIVAATNRRADRAGVTGLLETVKSRFASIVELDPDLPSWCAWAIGAGIPPELIAFLRFKPELLSDFRPSGDLVNSPSPRTWHSLAKLQALALPSAIETHAMIGAVGEGAAIEYLAFRRMVATLPSVDAILLDPANALLPSIKDPSALYAVCTALATRANPSTIGRILTYGNRMIDQESAEFCVLMVRDAMRRDPAIASTADFVRAACGPLGALISGTEVRS